MTLRRINTDIIGWETPPDVIGQPPVYHNARKGDVVDLPDDYIAKRRDVKVLVHYAVPGQPGVTVAQYEPILLDPEATGKTETRAAAEAEAAALRARLFEIENTMPAIPVDYSQSLSSQEPSESGPGVVLSPPAPKAPDVGELAAAKRRGRPPKAAKATPEATETTPEATPEPEAEPVPSVGPGSPLPLPEEPETTEPGVVLSDFETK